MRTSLKPSTAWPLMAVLAAETVFMASRPTLDRPFLASGFFGAAVIQIRTRRSGFEMLATVPLAAGLVMVRYGTHLRPLYEFPWLIGLFLGLASLFVMGAAVLRSAPHEMPGRIAAFGTALAVPLFATATFAVLPVTWQAHPATLDKILYAFDGSLGFQPSFVLGRLFGQLPGLRVLSKIAYEIAPLAVVVLYASTMGHGGRRQPNLLLLFGVASVAGFLLYGLLPAAGPFYLFPSRFPTSAPVLAGLALLPAALPAGVSRNAMPSLHMAWAVLMCWNARRSSIWLRAAYYLLLVLTVFYTLGSGEHYLIDLIVALPFSLAVQAAFSAPIRELARSLAFWAGSLGTLAWLAFLRFGAPVWFGSAALDWCLVAVTVAGSAMLARQATRKSRGSEYRREDVRPNKAIEATSAPP